MTATRTKISLFGGVSLRVPEGVDVVVEGIRVDDGRRTASPARTIKVREYSLFGGVHVEH